MIFFFNKKYICITNKEIEFNFSRALMGIINIHKKREEDLKQNLEELQSSLWLCLICDHQFEQFGCGFWVIKKTTGWLIHESRISWVYLAEYYGQRCQKLFWGQSTHHKSIDLDSYFPGFINDV